MTIGEMAEAIGRAHGAALDGLTRALWAGVGAGQIGDEDAARLAEAIEARRMAGKAIQAATSWVPLKIGPISRRKPQRPPVRSEAIERRRGLAASGPMPPALAARFTTGEMAVLRIVADEFRARKVCDLCLDTIAARAGVSRTTAQNAIRQAKRLGMVKVQERRRPGVKSLPNLVRIIDSEWLAWIKHHGFKKLNTTDKVEFREEEGRAAHLKDAPTFATCTNVRDSANEGRPISQGIACWRARR